LHTSKIHQKTHTKKEGKIIKKLIKTSRSKTNEVTSLVDLGMQT
jgi:hypothetical protein